MSAEPVQPNLATPWSPVTQTRPSRSFASAKKPPISPSPAVSMTSDSAMDCRKKYTRAVVSTRTPPVSTASNPTSRCFFWVSGWRGIAKRSMRSSRVQRNSFARKCQLHSDPSRPATETSPRSVPSATVISKPSKTLTRSARPWRIHTKPSEVGMTNLEYDS